MLVQMGASRSRSGFGSCEMGRVVVESVRELPVFAWVTLVMPGVWAKACKSFVFSSGQGSGSTLVEMETLW